MSKTKQKTFTLKHGLMLLIAGVFVDLLTKSIFFSLSQNIDLGLIHFMQHKNYGFIFGAFSEMKNLVRVVFFSTLGGYSIALYIVLLFFFRNKTIFGLKLGLTIFLVGILGNVIDKTVYGYVRDFINVDLWFFKKYVFNIADIFLTWGTIQNIISIFFYSDEIFKENSKRRGYLINKSYQYSYAFVHVSALLLLGLTLSLFSYSFLRSYIDPHTDVPSQVYFYFFFGIFMICSIYCVVAFLFTIIFTHRSVGPLIAFHRFVDQLKDNPNAKLKLREEDFHKELEDLSKKLQDLMKN
ncbi:MAG: signal peptidase II [Proteobacteria bacterium]|jgi:signal peptidase II|nr:signal peptidase II [Pseudomonadota bacterium]